MNFDIDNFEDIKVTSPTGSESNRYKDSDTDASRFSVLSNPKARVTLCSEHSDITKSHLRTTIIDNNFSTRLNFQNLNCSKGKSLQ